ncbi:MAG: hypothetical protein ACTHPS_27900 [Streptosporangiaceae bacterium]
MTGRPVAARGWEAGERPAPLRGTGGWLLDAEHGAGRVLYVCGATALRRSPDSGAYARRYHDPEHVNEVGHAGCRSVWYRPRHEPDR